MHQPVEIQFQQAATRLIDIERPLLLAVSGGGDSLAMVLLLLGMSSARRPTTTLIHLDHALRDDSNDDRRFVERLAAEHELPCIAERRAVVRDRDESLEEAARRVRRAFLIEHARRLDATVATGHTLDDQAETVLMRWARGAGPGALGGMSERGPGPFVRPLLRIERSALRRWLTARGHEWREDSQNDDPRFERVRARRLMPLLAAELNPRLTRHVCDAARRLQADARFLDELAAGRLPAISGTRDGVLEIDAGALAAEPPVLAARIAALALRRGGVDARRVLSHHVDGMLDLARGASGRRLDLPGRRYAERSGGVLRILDSAERPGAGGDAPFDPRLVD